MTSRPLFMRVEESIVIFGPMDHVGWARASFTLALASSSRVHPRNGPPDPVMITRRRSSRRSPRMHWARAACSESTGINRSGSPLTRSVTSSPPTMSDSLLARARNLPDCRAAGLGPTLAALQSGKFLALANKESLIVGGELVTDLVKGEPERLIPVDSEHAALAQCIRGERREDLRRVIITGSGGPFRGWTREELARASVKEALAHPTWSMGPKITIDSSTLMNKGLEVIEAHYLFDLPYQAIDVVIHPESIVHGIAEFRDGSMVAQMAPPDMRLPIQLALGWPERLPAGIAPLRLADPTGPLTLSFEPVDREAFPALDLAYRVGRMGSTYPAVMNAANEVAVTAFLDGTIPLPTIGDVVARAVDEHHPPPVVSLVNLERADGWARARAAEILAER